MSDETRWQTDVPPAEPDPGEGWRLIDEDHDEPKIQDELWSGDVCGWVTRSVDKPLPFSGNVGDFYRRRIELDKRRELWVGFVQGEVSDIHRTDPGDDDCQHYREVLPTDPPLDELIAAAKELVRSTDEHGDGDDPTMNRYTLIKWDVELVPDPEGEWVRFADVPGWHDKPTGPGLWLAKGKEWNQAFNVSHDQIEKDQFAIAKSWFGPIPPRPNVSNRLQKLNSGTKK